MHSGFTRAIVAASLVLASHAPASADTMFVSSFLGGTIDRFDLPSSTSTTVVFGLFSPEDGACSPDGFIYFAESMGGAITRWDQNGLNPVNIIPAAGAVDGPEGPTFDLAGNLFFNTREFNFDTEGAWRVDGGDPLSTATQVVPIFTSFGEGAEIVIAGPHAGGLLLVARGERKIWISEPPGASRTLFIDAPVFASDAVLFGVTTNGCGEVFVGVRNSFPLTSSVYRFDAEGSFIEVYADNFTDANFMDFDSDGNLYVADESGGSIWKVAPDKTKTVFASLFSPIGIAICRDRVAPKCLTCSAGGPYQQECEGPTTCVDLDASLSVSQNGPLTFQWATDCPNGDFGGTDTSPTPTLCMDVDSCLQNCTATVTIDDGVQTDSCSALITIRDTRPPTLTVPPALVLECDDPAGVPLTDPRIQAWLDDAAASDVCGGVKLSNDAPAVFLPTCGPATTVTFKAVDDCGLETELTSTVAVIDTTPPSLTVPPPLVLECEGPAGIPVTDPRIQDWLDDASGSDACGGVTITDDAPAVFLPTCGPATTVTFAAVDGCGLEVELTSTVAVVDSTPPSLTVPAPLVIECEGPAGIPVTDPRVQDWLDDAIGSDVCGDVTLSNDAPAVFLPTCGLATTVTFKAVDDCGLETELTSTVAVLDTTPPALTAPAPLVLECDGPAGIPLTDPRIQAWLATATASDVCGGVALSDDAPAVFLPSCLPGVATVVTFTAVDDCGLTTVRSSSVTVVDTIPPALVVPPPLVLECDDPDGVPLDDPRIQAWLAMATASDVCGAVTLSDDAPPVFFPSCLPGAPATVTFTAVDWCGLTTALSSTVTVVDTTPPDVFAMLEPRDPLFPSSPTSPGSPLPPRSPRSPKSVCSGPSSRAFVVRCGVDDICDEMPTLEAVLEVTHVDVPAPGVCEVRVEQIPVECDEVVEIRLLPPLCPGSAGSPRSPRSPRPSVSVNSDGIKVVSGERVLLEVTGTDSCNNVTVVTYDPAVEPDPLCEEVLDDGTCCPAIGQPPSPACEVPVCELPLPPPRLYRPRR